MTEADFVGESVGLKKYSKIKRIGHECNAGILDTGHLTADHPKRYLNRPAGSVLNEPRGGNA